MGALVSIIVVVAVLVVLGAISLLLLSRIYAQFSPDGQKPTLDDLAALWAKLKGSVYTRFVAVGFIALLMTIPLAFLKTVTAERQQRYESVLNDIAGIWGAGQSVAGPMLTIPVTETWTSEESNTNAEGKTTRHVQNHVAKKHVLVLPEQLRYDIDLKEDFKRRGIYNSLVYNTQIAINGDFVIPDVQKLSDKKLELHLDKAFVSVGLSDTKAISTLNPLNWQAQPIAFDPGLRVPVKTLPNKNELLQTVHNNKISDRIARRTTTEAEAAKSTEHIGGVSPGFHAPLPPVVIGQRYTFATTLNAKGSYGMRFATFGRNTTVNMVSSWPHPSFQGSAVPSKHSINSQGFSAQWRVPNVARNYPQQFILEDQAYNLSEFLAGVDLVEPVNLYSKVERSVKYGFLFIGLTFVMFMLFELKTSKRTQASSSQLHWLQYVVIGGALGLFYLSLLSLSEHLSFSYAYLISTAIIVAMVSVYVWLASQLTSNAVLIAVLLAALYCVLYSLLDLEDYALLAGTLLLLGLMVAIMVATRNLNKPST